MAVSNKGYFLFFRGLLIFLVFVVIADLLLSQIPGTLSTYFEDHIPAITSGCIILLLFGIRVNYFSYEDEYEIIAGERRWRAAQLAKLDMVPCLVKNVPDEAAVAIALIENIQREDLNPLEEAEGYLVLLLLL